MNTDEIARSILDARRDMVKSWLASPAGVEVLRLEAAYEALTGKRVPSLTEVAAAIKSNGHGSGTAQLGINEARRAAEAIVHGGLDRRHVLTLPRSIHDAARELMETTTDVWTYAAMIDYWGARGERFKTKDPRDALRTAMARLVGQGLAEKVGIGAFRGINKISHVGAADSLPSLGDGRGQG